MILGDIALIIDIPLGYNVFCYFLPWMARGADGYCLIRSEIVSDGYLGTPITPSTSSWFPNRNLHPLRLCWKKQDRKSVV